MPKTIMSLLVGSTLMIGNQAMAAPVHGPFDAPLADEVKVLEMLKKSGRIPTLASPSRSRRPSPATTARNRGPIKAMAAPLAVKEARCARPSSRRSASTHRPSRRSVPTLLLKAIERSTTGARCARTRSAILVDFPDYPEEQRAP